MSDTQLIFLTVLPMKKKKHEGHENKGYDR